MLAALDLHCGPHASPVTVHELYSHVHVVAVCLLSWGIWDLSSLTRNRTQAPCTESVEGSFTLVQGTFFLHSGELKLVSLQFPLAIKRTLMTLDPQKSPQTNSLLNNPQHTCAHTLWKKSAVYTVQLITEKHPYSLCSSTKPKELALSWLCREPVNVSVKTQTLREAWTSDFPKGEKSGGDSKWEAG